MVSKELLVKNETGIHARPAGIIVEMANKFKSEIFFTKDGIRANAKSIMSILFLAAEPGSCIEVEAEGADESQALDAIDRLFKAKFCDETR